MAERARRANVDEGFFGEESLRLFVASSRNLRNRLVHCVALTAGSMAFVPALWCLGWFAAALSLALTGYWIATRVVPKAAPRTHRICARVLFASTLANSSIYALWAVILWRSTVPAAHLFCIAMFFVSMIYVLMQYYAAAKLYVVVSAPYFAALGCIAVWRTAPSIAHGQLLVAVSLAAGAIGVANFVRNAREMLAQSRSALRKARALATEREAAAVAANQAKSAFLATISHEIRTPLNGVLGMAQVMEADELSKVQRERLEVIRHSGQTLLAILNDVLDFSKIEAGKLTLEDCDFDLAEIASGAVGVFVAMAESRGVSFSLTIEEEARGWYRGDPTRVRQILYNLVSNALKFTQEGGVVVTLGSGPKGLRISVEDTGVGIAPEALERLFEKFVQADAATTRRFGGTGLGLAICRELAQMMGGQISAQSEVGKGSVFTVELPLARATAPQKDERPVQTRDQPGPSQATSSLKVLAAEDNEVNRLVLKTLLSQAGLAPTLVGDGRQALEAWRREPWDLILMDIQMPEMDGLAATTAIRNEEKSGGRARTPIVALTADVLTHQTATYRAAGMDGFVAKPIEAARLFEAISEAFAQSDGAAEALQAG
jgi:signal transduction histidine kinase/CheY-like chemotaxis protein